MNKHYSALKLFEFPEKIQALKEGRITPPLHIRIKPTNTCNHKCWYCGYQNDDAAISLGEGVKLRDRIREEKMREISSDLIEMGVKAVTFTGGGEPLTYKHIAEFADRLLTGGIKVGMLTNGALLTGDKAQALADRASWVRVSMDGWDDESYEKYRGVKGGEHTKISNNLRDFARIKGRTTLGISLNVDKDNYSHIYEFARHMRDLGVDHLKISGCVVSNSGDENNKYHAPFFNQTNEIIAKAKSELEDGHFGIVNLYHVMPSRFDKEYTTCPFAQFLVVIGADENVYTCQDKAYTESGLLGSIKEKSFKEFWASEECRKALSSINPSLICQHHCVADSKNRLLHDMLNLEPDHLAFV